MNNQQNGLSADENGPEDFFCPCCEEAFSVSVFDDVDDEFDPTNPRCPDCKREQRIAGSECECGQPAAHEVESGMLCDDCFEDYASVD